MLSGKSCPTERWKAAKGRGARPCRGLRVGTGGDPKPRWSRTAGRKGGGGQVLGEQEQEGGVPRAEQNLMGSGGHHGGRGCSRVWHPAHHQGVVPTPTLSPSPVKLLWTQSCPWSWEEGWMSTEEAGPQGPTAGVIRPGPALPQRRQPAWVGIRERRSWGVPPRPLSQGNPSWQGKGAEGSPGPGVRVSHGQQLRLPQVCSRVRPAPRAEQRPLLPGGPLLSRATGSRLLTLAERLMPMVGRA